MISEIAAAFSQCDTVPSLKRLALLRATVSLCEKEDMKSKILKCSAFLVDSDYAELNYIEKEQMGSFQMIADEEVSQLCIPVTLKDDMSNIIWTVGLEILQWKTYHSKVLGLPIDELHIPLNNLCWTVHTMINKKKTAELIANDERVCITTRYVMACIYCLADNVRTLWEKVPKYDLIKPDFMENPLVKFWTQNTDPLHDPKPTWEFATHSVAIGSKTGIEYFALKSVNYRDWIGLLEEEFFSFNPTLLQYPEEDWLDTVFYVMSKMNEEEQLGVLDHFSSTLLKTILSKTTQSLFMEIADLTWEFLSEDEYGFLLIHILKRFLKGCNNYCIKIFQEFWKESPDDHKAYLSTHSEFGATYLDLLITFNFPFYRNERVFLKRARSFAASVRQNKRNRSDLDEGHWEILQFIIQAGVVTKHSLLHWKSLAEKGLSTTVKQRLRVMELILDDDR